MPLPPDIKKADTDNPYTALNNVKYNAPTSFMANIWDSLVANSFIRSMVDKYNADPDTTMLEQFSYAPQVRDYISEIKSRPPATPDDIKEASEGRPELNAPEGITKQALDVLVKRYDDKALYGFMANNPDSTLAYWAGFGGNIVGGALDLPSMAVGGAAGKATAKVVTPFAKQLMEHIAVKDLMGTSVPIIGTKIMQNGLTFGAGMGGYQATQEVGDEAVKSTFNQPTDWLGALQRVGTAAGYGTLIGGGLSAVGMGLFGYKRPIVGLPEVPRIEEGQGEGAPSPTENIPPSPQVIGEERVGGLLNSEFIKDLPTKTKEILARWKPWSKNADDLAREDAMAQAHNGQQPDVSLLLRQGAMEEGANFSNAIKDTGVDLADMDERLNRANSEADQSLTKLMEMRRQLDESDLRLSKLENVGIKTEKDVSQAGLVDRFKNASDLDNVTDTIPENVKKYIEAQNQIDELQNKLDLTPEGEETAPLQNRIQKLKTKLPKLYSPKEELNKIKNRLLKNGLEENYKDLPDYKRLTELAPNWEMAKNILDRVSTEADHQLQARELLGRKLVIDSMKNHINGSHPPVSPEELKAYAKRLDSVGMEPIAEPLSDTVNPNPEDPLGGLSETEIQQILEKAPESAKAELEAITRLREAQPNYRKMAKDLVNCILRNEV